MKKHISELRVDKKRKYYDTLIVWYKGSDRPHFHTADTIDIVKFDNGKLGIETTDYIKGLYYFVEGEPTIHMYHFSRSFLPEIEYFELVGREDED